jgi:hypothetical protein
VLAELASLIWSNLPTFVPLVGFVGLLVGVAMVIRIDVDVRGARRMSRILLAVTIALPFVGLAALIAQPGGPSPMFDARPWYAHVLPWAGAIGYLIGLGWMIRIYRADPEPEEASWRYRS